MLENNEDNEERKDRGAYAVKRTKSWLNKIFNPQLENGNFSLEDFCCQFKKYKPYYDEACKTAQIVLHLRANKVCSPDVRLNVFIQKLESEKNHEEEFKVGNTAKIMSDSKFNGLLAELRQ